MITRKPGSARTFFVLNKSSSITFYSPTGSNQHWAVVGGSTSTMSTTSANGQAMIGHAGRLSRLKWFLGALSNCNQIVDLDVLVSGITTALTIQIPALSTGLVEDDSNSVQCTENATIGYRCVSPAGTGNLERTASSMRFDF